jgi:hypothetical protein
VVYGITTTWRARLAWRTRAVRGENTCDECV